VVSCIHCSSEHNTPTPPLLETTFTSHDKTRNGETWMTQMITNWLHQWLLLWHIRNEICHGRDEQTKRETQDQQTILKAEIFHEENASKVDSTLQCKLAQSHTNDEDDHSDRLLRSRHCPSRWFHVTFQLLLKHWMTLDSKSFLF
jgi:hypothetical protein